MAVDVLTDMITATLLEQDALATEREVILEELAMAEDDPTDVGYETFLADVLGPDTALGRPVGGTDETMNALTIDDVRAHFDEHYRPDNLVDHRRRRHRSRRDGRAAPDRPAPRRLGAGRGGSAGLGTALRTTNSARGGPPANAVQEVSTLASHRLDRPTEQNHIYLGGQGLTALSEDRHTLSVLMSILGGGMSSRLFQNIREQRGLAYSVYSFSAGYRDAGLFGMYAACRPVRTAQVVELLAEELDQDGRQGIEQ